MCSIMKTLIGVLCLSITVLSRDFYMGMFKPNDNLVADDYIYKGATPYSFSYAKYGRRFHCLITYFRLVDRLGVGRGPTVKIVRGGLRKKYIVIRIKSPYNQPISANIYVGCENKQRLTKTTAKREDGEIGEAGDKKKSSDPTVDSETSTAGAASTTESAAAVNSEDITAPTTGAASSTDTSTTTGTPGAANSTDTSTNTGTPGAANSTDTSTNTGTPGAANSTDTSTNTGTPGAANSTDTSTSTGPPGAANSTVTNTATANTTATAAG